METGAAVKGPSLSQRFRDLVRRGEWKTPLKVLIVVALGSGLGAGLAIVIQQFA